MEDESNTPSGFTDQRRLPYKDKKIDEITQNDIKVRFVGMIIEKSGDLLIVDDGSAQVKVMTENAADLDVNNTVRVLGRVIPIENGVEISAEITQDFSDADMELYKKMIESEKSIGV